MHSTYTNYFNTFSETLTYCVFINQAILIWAVNLNETAEGKLNEGEHTDEYYYYGEGGLLNDISYIMFMDLLYPLVFLIIDFAYMFKLVS